LKNQLINNMKKYQGIIWTFVGAVAVIGLLWFLQTASKSNSAPPVSTSGILSAEESSFNFGNVSMAAGKVSHSFTIKNIGSEPLSITRIYTSCMCTEAKLFKNNNTIGPFGMQGMGYNPALNEILMPNEQAQIQVVFDPAAHGPAGLGRIERTVSVENNGKGRLDISISASVMP